MGATPSADSSWSRFALTVPLRTPRAHRAQGNKGAVGIRFNLYNSSLCFINSHLAAHQHNSAGRNSDYQNICARLAFQDAKSKIQKGSKVTLFEHESVGRRRWNRAEAGAAAQVEGRRAERRMRFGANGAFEPSLG